MMVVSVDQRAGGRARRTVAGPACPDVERAAPTAQARSAMPDARPMKPSSEQIMTKSYILAKTIFASFTVLVAEAAFLGVNNGAIDWRLIAVSAALAWGVIQIVEFFLLRDAMENSIAKGVVDWIKGNLEADEAQATAPASAINDDIPKLAISTAAE
jgi:hypothetical protein